MEGEIGTSDEVFAVRKCYFLTTQGRPTEKERTWFLSLVFAPTGKINHHNWLVHDTGKLQPDSIGKTRRA